MKRKLNLIGMSLGLLAISLTTHGQSSQAEPGRTAEEQAAYEMSIPVNPAKMPAAVQDDPRMDPSQVQAGPTNWKPATLQTDNREAPDPGKVGNIRVSQTIPAVNRTQPAGEQPAGKTMNRRDLKGSDTQAEAPHSGNVTSYRNLDGPETQPEGQKPENK